MVPLASEVLRAGYDPIAEKMVPETVNIYSRSERILLIRDPFGEFLAPAGLRSNLRRLP